MKTTKRLLLLGALAGPVFCLLVLAQASVREGFNLARHPLSLLAVGNGGWVQTSNFIITGLLAAAGGFGLARATCRRSLAALLSIYGTGLLIAAAFRAPPAKGFPPGSIESSEMSFSATMHGVGFMVANVGILSACLVMAAQFRREGRTMAMIGSVSAALANPILVGLGFSSEKYIGLFFFSLGVVTLGWLTLVCIYQSSSREQQDLRD